MPRKLNLARAMKPSKQNYTKKGTTQMTFVIDDTDMFRFRIACLLMEKKKISEVLREIVKEYTEKAYKEYKEKHGEIDLNKLI
jgi:Tfp pilus assembly ATPase PilU